MKRWIWMTLLLVTLLSVVIWEQIFMDRTMNELTYKSEVLQSAITGQNAELSKTLVKEIDDFWNEREAVLTCMIDHNEIEDIGKLILYIDSYLNNGDFEAALAECNFLIYRASLGASIFNFDIPNIL